MSGTSMELNYTDNSEKVVRALQQLHRKGIRPRPLLLSMGEYLVRSTDDRFDAQKTPAGLPWAPLRPATLIRKKIKKILTERSRLRNSITYRAGDNSLEWGTNVIYGRIHQEGGEIEHKERDQVIHFKRGTVDQFANKDGANRELHLADGQVLHFRRKAGAGFAKPNMKASYAMKVKVDAHTTTMPARPYLGISAADGHELLERVHEYYLSAVRA